MALHAGLSKSVSEYPFLSYELGYMLALVRLLHPLAYANLLVVSRKMSL